MNTLRIVLIALLVFYRKRAFAGAILSFFNQTKMAEMQHLCETTVGLQKLLLLSGAMLAGQV